METFEYPSLFLSPLTFPTLPSFCLWLSSCCHLYTLLHFPPVALHFLRSNQPTTNISDLLQSMIDGVHSDVFSLHVLLHLQQPNGAIKLKSPPQRQTKARIF